MINKPQNLIKKDAHNNHQITHFKKVAKNQENRGLQTQSQQQDKQLQLLKQKLKNQKQKMTIVDWEGRVDR